MGLVVAIVLAAGSSSRMGTDKLGLQLGPRSVLEHSLAAYDDCPGIGARLLVTAGLSGATQRPPGWTLAPNPLAHQGMGASLRAGLQAAPPEAAAYLLGLADLPALQASTVAAVLRAWRSGGHQLVAPSWKGRQGHPVLVGAGYRRELLRVEGDQGARLLLRRHGAQLHRVPVDDPGAVLDMDRPEQLAQLQLTPMGPRWSPESLDGVATWG